MPRVTKIPATINPITHLPTLSPSKRKVAAYARVSTESDEQYTSYAAQVDYYTKFIKSKPDWEFVKVYTDEGISGTNTKKRDGFKKMIADALDGKIDLIVTKSVSRFARNTVDSLTTIRKLKERGTECFFEKEGIYTFDSKGELLITIMSSLAQEESRSISENVTWGQRKSFSDGKVHLPYKRFLGYEKGEDGRPKIIEEEAEIVRLIYRLFLDGQTPVGICKHLEESHILTPGKREKWSKTTVLSILQNEKYKGDALLQKSFTVDFLQKRIKTNEGEVPQYYVENSHPAIIPPEEWERVQSEILRRKSIGKAYSGKSPLCAKLICEDCGSFYGRKIWHSTDKYKRVIWRCSDKYSGSHKCQTPTLETEKIQQMFITAYNILMANKQEIIDNCELIMSHISDCTDIDEEIQTIIDEMSVIAELVKKEIQGNASSIQSQEEYQKRYNSLTEKYDKLSKKAEHLQKERIRKVQQEKQLRAFIESVKRNPCILTEWNDTIWLVMVEKGIVHKNKSITFVFWNGEEITVEA